MNTDEARIIILEDALVQAIRTVEFLHGCLTEPSLEELGRIQAVAIRHYVTKQLDVDTGGCSGYECAYPKQNLDHLANWHKLVEMPLTCHHSSHFEECEACRALDTHRAKMANARAILADPENTDWRSQIQNDTRPSQPPQAQAQPQPQSAPPATPDLNMGTPIWLTESFDPANLTTKNQNS